MRSPLRLSCGLPDCRPPTPTTLLPHIGLLSLEKDWSIPSTNTSFLPHLIFSLNHGSTSSSSPRMPQADGPELTLQKFIKMHEASLRRVHIDVNDDNKERSAGAEPLSGEGDEHESDEVHPKIAQT